MISEKNTKQELLEEYKRLVSKAKEQKVSIPAQAKGISSKSTKADILNAIQLLQEKFSPSSPAAIEISPVPAVPAPKPAAPAKPAKPAMKSTKEEDTDLNYLKPEIKDEIEALNAAKKLKKQEYALLLAIEQELVNFVAMINTNKNNNFSQEESHIEQRMALEQLLAEDAETVSENNQKKLDEANQRLLETEETIAKEKEALMLQRTTEEEQYRYELTKTHKEDDDLWSDELAKREEAIAGIKSEIAALQADIDSKQELVAELQAKIDEIPQLLEKAQQEGAEAKEKELGKEHGYKTNMAKKDAEVAAQSLQKQIDRLKADYEAVLLEKNAIQEKLDKAYEESNKLYMQTVQSTGGVKILSNLDKN